MSQAIIEQMLGKRCALDMEGLSGATGVLEKLVAHAFAHMKVSPGTELSIAIVGESEMERIHIDWMDLPGPTDVMSFPMDELTPGTIVPNPSTAPHSSMTGNVSPASPPV